MGEVILRGHKVFGGSAGGQAVVSHQPISFAAGVDPETGLVVEKNHDLEGVSLTGKILVFPVEKGSTMGSFRLYEMAHYGTQPKGIITLRAGSIVTVGAIISNIPMVDKLNNNPIELIKTGDYVQLDADAGVVKVTKITPDAQ